MTGAGTTSVVITLSGARPSAALRAEIERLATAVRQTGGRCEVVGDPELTRTDEPPLRVLFVCTANICRSAFLEVAARQRLGTNTDLEISSAGTHGMVGSEIYPEIAAHVADDEIRRGFRARRVDGRLLAAADLVLTAEAGHRSIILEEHPEAIRKIFTVGQFAEAAQGSDLAGRELVAELGAKRSVPDAGLDIEDPYRRGPEKAAAAAALMGGLLDVLLPALAPSAAQAAR